MKKRIPLSEKHEFELMFCDTGLIPALFHSHFCGVFDKDAKYPLERLGEFFFISGRRFDTVSIHTFHSARKLM